MGDEIAKCVYAYELWRYGPESYGHSGGRCGYTTVASGSISLISPFKKEG